MSELTPCNYCSFERMKMRAKRDGKKLTTTSKLLTKDKDERELANLYPSGVNVLIDGKFAAWFAELPKSCCC